MKKLHRFLIVIPALLFIVSASTAAMLLGQLTASMHSYADDVVVKHSYDVMDSALAQQRRETIAAFVRFAYLHGSTAASDSISGPWMLRHVLGFSPDESLAADLHDDAFARTREQVLRSFLLAHESDALTSGRLHAGAEVQP